MNKCIQKPEEYYFHRFEKGKYRGYFAKPRPFLLETLPEICEKCKKPNIDHAMFSVAARPYILICEGDYVVEGDNVTVHFYPRPYSETEFKRFFKEINTDD